MRSPIDRLLARWYVPRSDVLSYRRGNWMVTCNEHGYSMSECCCTSLHEGPCTSPEIIITTDYQQAPCS